LAFYVVSAGPKPEVGMVCSWYSINFHNTIDKLCCNPYAVTRDVHGYPDNKLSV